MSNERPPDSAGTPYPPVPPPPYPPSMPPAPPGPPAPPPAFGTVYPQGAPAPYPPVWDQRPKRSGMAIAALVLGIIGLVLCFLGLFSILAIVFGLISASQIKKGAGSITGLGLARAGWILGLIGLLIGAGFWVAAATGAFDEEGATDVDALVVGDCVTLDPDETVVFDLPVVACAQPHTGEVIAIGELNPSGDREYPGDEANEAEVDAMCAGNAFDSYVGTAYADSELDIYYFYTQRLRWNKDRGEYICIAYSPDGETLIGSIRGSGR